MKALALDLGASGGKIFLGNFDGRKIAVKEIHRFPNEPYEESGHLFWDIRGIHENLLQGISKAAPENFTSFGVDAFCNDYGLLDRSGNLLSKVFMYRDCRTDGVLEKMDRVMPAAELYKRTGCQRARFNTLVQLVAELGGSDRSIIDHADTLLFVPDLLNYFLCGEKVAEFTVASVSQVYNRLLDKWDDQIIKNFDLSRRIFPQVVPSAHILASANSQVLEITGAKSFSICTVGHHDTASAVVAVPNPGAHIAYISSGTWSLMGTETDQMITTPDAFQFNFANEGGVGGRNRFLKNIMGLWLLQECQKEWDARGITRSFSELDLEAESCQPFRSIIDPDDPDFFMPGGMIDKIQQKCSQSDQPVPETPGQINRCIKESLALVYRRTLEKIEQVTGFSIPKVNIIGGGAKSSLLNQFAASAMHRPVYAGPFEAAAVGNLCAQWMSSGEIRDLTQARQIVCDSFEVKEFLPDESLAWDEAYQGYLDLLNRDRSHE